MQKRRLPLPSRGLFGALFALAQTALLAGLALPAGAQRLSRDLPTISNAGTRTIEDDILVRLDGNVLDLAVRPDGAICYGTREGEVGVFLDGTHTILAPIGSLPGGQELRAVTYTPAGDVAALLSAGDIYTVPQPGGAPVQTYDDLFMVIDPTDFLCDSQGNFIIASSSPSNGQRAVNWVSSDGFRWGYFLVEHEVHMPVALAIDPSTDLSLIHI